MRIPKPPFKPVGPRGPSLSHAGLTVGSPELRHDVWGLLIPSLPGRSDRLRERGGGEKIREPLSMEGLLSLNLDPGAASARQGAVGWQGVAR